MYKRQLYFYFQREDSIVHTVSHAGKLDVALFFVEQYAAIFLVDVLNLKPVIAALPLLCLLYTSRCV